MRTCADCGEALFDLTRPCPKCGGLRQSAAVQAKTVLGIAATIQAGISLSFNSDPPWYAKWQDVRQRLMTVEEACRPSSYRGNDTVKRSFENFFVDCFHMGDWLWEDPSTGLTKTQVSAFIGNDPSLRVCEGLANTGKHRVRSKPGGITARIKSISPRGSGTEVVIEWSQGSNVYKEDALDLARRCRIAWESYLMANGLHSPI